MRTRLKRIKYKTTALVCGHVMIAKKISGRALARQLGIHFTTWHRYVRGERRPNTTIKARLVSMMGVENFIELIQRAYKDKRRIQSRLK